MSNVVDIFKNAKDEDGSAFELMYLTNSKDKIIGVTHSDWPFSIQMTDDGAVAGFVSDDNGESFGRMSKAEFNMMLLSWLLLSDPELLDEAVRQGMTKLTNN